MLESVLRRTRIVTSYFCVNASHLVISLFIRCLFGIYLYLICLKDLGALFVSHAAP